MTKKPQKRGNDYYLDRLRIDHPAIYADLQSKKFKNATEAFVAAGLRKQKMALDTLLSAWSKATPAEQAVFRARIGCVAAPLPIGARPGLLSTATQKSSRDLRHLPQQLEKDLRTLMDQRGLTAGDVMRQMGMKPLNASLGMALHRATRVSDTLISALTKWVNTNKTP